MKELIYRSLYEPPRSFLCVFDLGVPRCEHYTILSVHCVAAPLVTSDLSCVLLTAVSSQQALPISGLLSASLLLLL